jgi:hypothetical protein
MSTEASQHYLARRGNWQLVAQQGGTLATSDTASVIRSHLDTAYPGQYEVVREPTDLKWMYFDYTRKLEPAAYAKPAHPTGKDLWWDEEKGIYMTWAGIKEVPVRGGGGCIPDIKITHIPSGRRMFLEVKHQNDAGNAHERAAKFATASVIAHVQKMLGVTYNPFAHVFTGEMVESRKYQVELVTTYGFDLSHLFLWKVGRPVEPLVEWLEAIILPNIRDTPAQ